MLWRDPGEHGRVGHDGEPAGIVEAGQVPGVDGLQGGSVRGDVQVELACDLGRRRLLVAGDHDRADAGGAAGGDGGPDALPQRVAHPDEPDEGQVAREIRLDEPLGQHAMGQPEDAQRRGRERLVRVFDVRSLGR